MRLRFFLAIMLVAVLAQAKEPKHYQSGKLLKMESVKCGTDAKNGKSLAGEMIGTDSAHMKTREMLCQQYVLLHGQGQDCAARRGPGRQGTRVRSSLDGAERFRRRDRKQFQFGQTSQQ